MRSIRTLLALTFLLLSLQAGARHATHEGEGLVGDVQTSDLPREARETLERIHAGGPFPYSRDGIRFENFEGRLPPRPRGTYHEYTVVTPGGRNRGARRIIVGDGVAYYTDDHYQTFRRILE